MIAVSDYLRRELEAQLVGGDDGDADGRALQHGLEADARIDLAARLLGEIPVGVVTAVIGAPFFLFLLRRSRSGYEL